MTLRPVPARWFEALTDREHVGAVLRALAATGAVEIEAHSEGERLAALPDYRATLAEYAELAQRYGTYWPPAAIDPALPPPESLAGARDALAALRAWAREAEAPIARVQSLATAVATLAELAHLLRAPGARLPSPAALGAAGPALATRVYAIEGAGALALPAGVLALEKEVGSGRYLVAVGAAEDVADLDRRLLAARCRPLELPPGLPADPSAAATAIETRLAATQASLAAARAELDALAARHHLPGLLAGFRFLSWLVAHVPQLPATEHFAYVTGWTDDLDGSRLTAALERERLPHLLHFPEAPRTLAAPLVLRNARWARPFETFVRLLGTPGAGEADPTPVVALLAPLLFGFMFGDVGQGLVLAVVGLALRRRYPMLRLLVPGGLVAATFGLAFGAVFAREDLIAPLWIRPLESPLVVLATTIAFGALVIVAGFVIDALQHGWRGQAARWWEVRGGLLALYVGLVVAPLHAGGLVLVIVGLAWYVVGAFATRKLGPALGELVETALQLVVNTVSFARVGAFALAHAGLGAAITGLADAAGAGGGLAGDIGYVAALVLGNALVIALEGMVVAIQTTRLVLFEFFIRFLRAEGRPFRPLPLPSDAHPPEVSS
jgi:V/A-type H+-transporting ATPase subunit I